MLAGCLIASVSCNDGLLQLNTAGASLSTNVRHDHSDFFTLRQ
jgi:hypothetical protein